MAAAPTTVAADRIRHVPSSRPPGMRLDMAEEPQIASGMVRRTLIGFFTTLFLLANPLFAQRSDVLLKDGWRFLQADAAGAEQEGFDDQSWKNVVIPHAWGCRDESSDKPDEKHHDRGPGWYRRVLEVPDARKGARTFLRIEAASLVADVHLNGAHLGQHRGGFTAFTYEITDALKAGKNLLAVRVDDSFFNDVAPLSGDFTYFGGLYRDVHVIQTGPLCISPLVHGGSGVIIRQSDVSRDQATVSVKTHVSDMRGAVGKFVLRTTILDAAGQTATAAESAHQSDQAIQALVIRQPHLWNGIADPYLYSVRVELLDDGKVVDSVTQPLGLRFFSFDKDKGFSLNGQPYRIHGVCRHQDHSDKGWAISGADMEQDMALMREMGANAVRLAHYPHSDHFLQLCDRHGVIAWSEVPLVNSIGKGEPFVQNASQQLEEMITQLGNHPSIAAWGLWNELQGGDPALPVIRKLHSLAHELDATRPTTAASFAGSRKWCPDATKVTDLLAINAYPGWYRGTAQDMGGILDDFRKFAPDQPLAVSEYGAGASIRHHQQGMTTGPKARGEWHPEEWQAIVHEINWKEIEQRPYIWGSFIWNMFDFSSAGRKEGDTPGVNDKGLVTRDRKVKKDAFYFYKASWSPEPVVRITSSRHVTRAEALTPVKIYSNAESVELTLNGKKLPAGECNGVIHCWKEVTLKEGDNVLVATAKRDGKTVTDQVTWVYDPAAADKKQ